MSTVSTWSGRKDPSHRRADPHGRNPRKRGVAGSQGKYRRTVNGKMTEEGLVTRPSEATVVPAEQRHRGLPTQKIKMPGEKFFILPVRSTEWYAQAADNRGTGYTGASKFLHGCYRCSALT